MATGKEEFFAGAALGFRAWVVIDGELWPLWYRQHPWTPGITTASCANERTGHEGRAAQDCHCGLHAYHSLQGAGFIRSRTPAVRSFIVIGAVAGGREVQVHYDGWRAAEAQVLGLWYDFSKHVRSIELLAQHYGVSTFRNVAELEERLPDYVAEIPMSSRPPKPPSDDDADLLFG